MKKNKLFWNYIDMLITIFIFLTLIIVLYFIAESLERYIYRYTLFPFISFILIFVLGLILGRGVERTRKNKPIGFFSKKMNKLKKKQNMFIFSDDGETYVPHKEIIDDLRSGEIVHVKQFEDINIDIDDFTEIYKVHIDNLVDNKMESEDKEK